MKMTKLFRLGLLATAIFIGQSVSAQERMESNKVNTMVGGAEMLDTKTIVENASNSKDHTTLVDAVKSADLVEVLSSKGPFTVFAPTNEAFDGLSKATMKSIMDPDHKEKLQSVLKYHVVEGKWSAKDLIKLINDAGGEATIKTVDGANLTARQQGADIYLSDNNGNSAKITVADVNQSNGVIHVIDNVLLPGMPK